MSPQIDFSAVPTQEPLPAGEYLGKIVHAEEGISNRSHEPKIDYRVEVIAPEEFAGRQFFDMLSFHPEAVRKVKQKLIGLGFTADFAGDVTADSLMGREAAFLVEIEKGKEMPEEEASEPGEKYPDRNRVRRIRPAEKYGKQTVASDALQALEVPEPTAARGRGRRTE